MNDESVDSPEGTELITCMACRKRTPLPKRDAPWGSAVICINCHAPLMGSEDPEQPLSTLPERVEKVYGMSGRGLEHPRCPFCNKINYGIVFPARGMSLGWYAVKEPENPKGFSFKVACIHCNTIFHVEWDESPLKATCSVCGNQTEDPEFSRVICHTCAAKVSKMRNRTQQTQPPGTRVEYVSVVGFGRMPEKSDVDALGSSDKEVWSTHLRTSMMSGNIPQTLVELGLISAQHIASHGRERLGHEVDWGKVTYERFQDLLVVKFWE